MIYGVAAVGFALFALLPPQLLYFFTREATTLREENLGAFLSRLTLYGVAIAAFMAVSLAGKIVAREWLNLRLELHLRRQLLRRLHGVEGSVLQGSGRGEWMTRLSADVQAVETFLGIALPDLFYGVAMVMGTAILLSLHTGWVALLPFVSALVVALVYVAVQRKLAPALDEMRQLHAGLFQMLLENLEAWKTIRSFDAAPFENARVERKLEHYEARGRSAAGMLSRVVGLNHFGTHVVIPVCLGLAAWSLVQGRISANEALLYPFYLAQFFFAVHGIVLGAQGWSRYAASASRLMALLELPLLEESKRRAIQPAASVISRARGFELSDFEVGFPGGPALFGGMSLAVEKGQIRALVGPSGSGKSTLLEFLSGLRAAKADRVELVSETGSRTLARYSAAGSESTHVLSGLFAFVEQKPYLFEGTLRSNLTLGREGISDNFLLDAMESAALADEFRARGGLDSVINDGGQNLSAGQRYRVALARALLLERPFLLLDEPFASLDRSTAEKIVGCFERIKTEKGILIVSHYLPASLALDAVYEIEAGRFVEVFASHKRFPAFQEGPGVGVGWGAADRHALRSFDQSVGAP